MGKNTSLFFFQITIGRTHTLKTKGLSDAWAALPQNAKRSGVCIVFVVPETQNDGHGFSSADKAPGFMEQRLEGTEEEIEQWTKRSTQMILRIPMRKH